MFFGNIDLLAAIGLASGSQASRELLSGAELLIVCGAVLFTASYQLAASGSVVPRVFYTWSQTENGEVDDREFGATVRWCCPATTSSSSATWRATRAAGSSASGPPACRAPSIAGTATRCWSAAGTSRRTSAR